MSGCTVGNSAKDANRTTTTLRIRSLMTAIGCGTAALLPPSCRRWSGSDGGALPIQKTYSDAPKTKHDGFFINKGTLELANEESESSAQDFVRSPSSSPPSPVTVHSNAKPCVPQQEGKKKRKRSLDKDGKEIKAKESSGDAKDKKERPKKKTKTGSADSSPAKEGEGKKGSKIQALTFQSTSPSSASSGQFAAPKPKAPTAVSCIPPYYALLIVSSLTSLACRHRLSRPASRPQSRPSRELFLCVHVSSTLLECSHCAFVVSFLGSQIRLPREGRSGCPESWTHTCTRWRWKPERRTRTATSPRTSPSD